ncbi:MAG: putative metal-dependent hydrolase [Anaerolineae bacterium]|nr:putative metal-dependent hydrolase [Anaerolineae bacterium]
MANRQEKIEKIRVLPAQVEALVKDLSDADLYTAYLPDEWTVAQNVHHLADSHMNSFIRIKLLLTEDKPTIKPYDQDAWAQTPDASKLPIESSLTLLKGLHTRWVQLLESASDSDWARTVIHPELGEVSLDRFLDIYSDHGEAHLDQMQRTLAAKG